MSLNFRSLAIAVVLLFLLPGYGLSEPPGKLTLPANTSSILDHIYSGRRDLALPEIHKLEEQAPDDPLGYLLEAEAEWWRIWCDSAEFKYGMTMARHHEKAASDQRYLELTAKAYTLAKASYGRIAAAKCTCMKRWPTRCRRDSRRCAGNIGPPRMREFAPGEIFKRRWSWIRLFMTLIPAWDFMIIMWTRFPRWRRPCGS